MPFRHAHRSEPPPVDDVGDPPPELTVAERKVWLRTVAAVPGMLKVCEHEVLATYCRTAVRQASGP